MKIIKDVENFTIFLNNFYTKELDFNNKETLENYFKNLFFKLKDDYDIEIIGFYNVFVYIDTNYGIILDVFKENLDYFDYFGNSIDMQVSRPIKANFLYKISDPLSIPKTIFKKLNIYKYKNNFYLKIKHKLKDIELATILEHTQIVFNNKEIIRNGRLVEVK